MSDKITAIKGFNRDLTCRGFQFTVGGTFEEPTADLCRTGFHAVTVPLDVFSYYPPSESVYRTVTLEGVTAQNDGDSKIAGRKITVGASLGIPGLVSAHIEWVLSNAKKDPKAHTDADQSAASSTGYQSAASSTGDQSAASSTGDRSAASSTGYRSAASSTGDQSAASSTGDRSAASSTGYQSAASSTGYRSAASSTGDQSAASSTGDQSAASSNGDYGTAQTSTREGKPESVATVTGYKGAAAGSLGDWLVLTERDGNYRILTVKTVRVDGKKILADVFYTVAGGKIVRR